MHYHLTGVTGYLKKSCSWLHPAMLHFPQCVKVRPVCFIRVKANVSISVLLFFFIISGAGYIPANSMGASKGHYILRLWNDVHVLTLCGFIHLFMHVTENCMHISECVKFFFFFLIINFFNSILWMFNEVLQLYKYFVHVWKSCAQNM